jgi:rubrerythrin
MNNYAEIIKYAMNLEKKAEEFYGFYKDKAKSQSIKDVFEGLSAMEDEHYNILKNQLERAENNQPFDEVNLKLEDGEKVIFNREKDLDNVNLSYELSDLPILRMAYTLENDFANFYEKAAAKATDLNAKKLLETLAYWENEHRVAFAAEIEYATKNSWFEQEFFPF